MSKWVKATHTSAIRCGQPLRCRYQQRLADHGYDALRSLESQSALPSNIEKGCRSVKSVPRRRWRRHL
jgi:hypothetical protein